ncbi:hypothetical protein ACQ5SP_15485 [Rhodovulum sp. YNF3179]|uniref:hypothetical protein n=1 Tax=Rhodovulum sp. YNF3179 TaxID=3425127 RepID=UPI003D351DA0
MLRQITLALAAGAVALAGLTATAAPARADGEDIAKALAGVATIFIIGKAIEQAKDDRRDKAKKPARKARHHGGGDRQCLRQIRRHGEWVSYYDRKCLKRQDRHRDRAGYRGRDRHADRYPRTCQRKRWTRHGWESYYAQRCLRRHGF